VINLVDTLMCQKDRVIVRPNECRCKGAFPDCHGTTLHTEGGFDAGFDLQMSFSQ
jgi:hypothetical protein